MPSPEIVDLFLTGAAARAEHYEIAAYERLVGMANALGETKTAILLEKNLKQENATLRKVSTIATRLNDTSAKHAKAAPKEYIALAGPSK